MEKNQEKEPLPNWLKTTIVEHSQVVKDDSSSPTPSRGFPIRYLALQKISKLPPVMFTLEHEEDYHKEESFTILESFIVLSIGREVSHKVVCLSYFLIHLAALLYEGGNQLVRKGSYFKKLVNGFV